MTATVYLIPSVVDETAIQTIPAYIKDAILQCNVIFAENERTARRFLKSIWKDIVIDNYEWHAIHKVETEQLTEFRKKIAVGKTIAIISEAGCPGVADPGQILIAAAQEMNAIVKPLVGPSSILLALMASGMNGQHFEFLGYLPIDNSERTKAISNIELNSQKKNCTQIFIETPYRNNQLLEVLFKTCRPATRLCIAVDLTGQNEMVKTKTIGDWKKEKIDLHKKPAIFLLLA
ncbi:MAG TPA: SAM-dependent methyltransferase [Ferruginibacter sp.]|nr:SAM-dependent methyltransferase [Ferruginibacter sp.]